MRASGRGRGRQAEIDELWLDFRDRFGLFWGQRVREQFNRSAVNAGWPVYLAWRGLRLAVSTIPEHALQEAMLAISCGLLKARSAWKVSGTPTVCAHRGNNAVLAHCPPIPPPEPKRGAEPGSPVGFFLVMAALSVSAGYAIGLVNRVVLGRRGIHLGTWRRRRLGSVVKQPPASKKKDHPA